MYLVNGNADVPQVAVFVDFADLGLDVGIVVCVRSRALSFNKHAILLAYRARQFGHVITLFVVLKDFPPNVSDRCSETVRLIAVENQHTFATFLHFLHVNPAATHDVIVIAHLTLLLCCGKCCDVVIDDIRCRKASVGIATDAVNIDISTVLTYGKAAIGHRTRAELVYVCRKKHLTLDVSIDENTCDGYCHSWVRILSWVVDAVSPHTGLHGILNIDGDMCPNTFSPAEVRLIIGKAVFNIKITLHRADEQAPSLDCRTCIDFLKQGNNRVVLIGNVERLDVKLQRHGRCWCGEELGKRVELEVEALPRQHP